MPEKKDIYVVSSLHYSPSKKENVENHIWDIVDVRLEVIGAIAKTLKKGSFFSDGINEELAENDQILLQRATIKQIRSGATEFLHRGGQYYFTYDHFRAIELLKRLKSQGIRFDVKKTEECEAKSHELIDHYYGELESSFPEEVLKSKSALAVYVKQKITELRDRDIVNNIATLGDEVNILYVGNGHKLGSLQSYPGLISYRLEVYHDMPKPNPKSAIVISGEIPDIHRSQFAMIAPVTNTGKRIISDVKYL